MMGILQPMVSKPLIASARTSASRNRFFYSVRIQSPQNQVVSSQDRLHDDDAHIDVGTWFPRRQSRIARGYSTTVRTTSWTLSPPTDLISEAEKSAQFVLDFFDVDFEYLLDFLVFHENTLHAVGRVFW
jgi:hypothetical protein